MPEPYAPRTRVRLDPVEVAGFALRVHWIDVEGRTAPPSDLLAAALDHSRLVLPAAAGAEGGAEEAGALILHRGAQGTWLLMHWWAHGDILCGRLSRAEPGSASFEPVHDRPLIACVWEIEAMMEERDAWVRTMMTARPSRDAWLTA